MDDVAGLVIAGMQLSWTEFVELAGDGVGQAQCGHGDGHGRALLTEVSSSCARQALGHPWTSAPRLP